LLTRGPSRGDLLTRGASRDLLIRGPSISGCRTPETCQGVIDLQLQEEREENKILKDQIKELMTKKETIEKQVCDLQLHSEITEREATVLKRTNLELQGKVCRFISTFLLLWWACYSKVNVYFSTKQGR
jgi:hypothetical protein